MIKAFQWGCAAVCFVAGLMTWFTDFETSRFAVGLLWFCAAVATAGVLFDRAGDGR